VDVLKLPLSIECDAGVGVQKSGDIVLNKKTLKPVSITKQL
jgi:hypothetical protein